MLKLPVVCSFTLDFILAGPEKPPGEHGRPQSCGEPENPEQGKLRRLRLQLSGLMCCLMHGQCSS